MARRVWWTVYTNTPQLNTCGDNGVLHEQGIGMRPDPHSSCKGAHFTNFSLCATPSQQEERGRLNDNQEREARLKKFTLKHRTIEISWLLIHLKRDKAGCGEVMSANQCERLFTETSIQDKLQLKRDKSTILDSL